ncbi:Caleosin-domain-containing protein, partial [Rozella allomycis CSF55]
MTVLQQHISFFDRNKDGIIYPWETWEGFRVMGFNLLMSLIGTFLIHLTMAIPSWDSIFYFDPFMGVLVKNIHSCKHGSDSEVYDTEGRFVPQKFEEIFSKYAKSDPEYLTLGELFCFTEGNRNSCCQARMMKKVGLKKKIYAVNSMAHYFKRWKNCLIKKIN